MPSVSKQQQKFMGIVRAIQKGDAPASKFSKAARDAAKDMSKSDVKKYAKTKHKGLPRKVKQELLDRLKKEYAFYHTGTFARKRKHDDDNNLGRKKKHSGQPDIEESKFARKPEVTPKQLLKIQNDVRKINRKIRVYISKHPVSKGELNIELGHGHDNDAEIHKIYKVLQRHTGSWKTGRMFNENVVKNHDGKAAPYGSGYKKVDEVGVFPIKNYLKGMIPKTAIDTTTPQKRERLKSLIKDLVATLNDYWKSHNIPYRVKQRMKI